MAKLISSPRMISAGLGRHDRHAPNRIRRPAGFPYWLLEYTASGAALMNLEKGQLEAREGSLFVYAPGARQSYETIDERGPWVHYWVCFQPRSDWLDWLAWPQLDEGFGFLGPVDLVTRDHVKSCFDSLVNVYHGPLPQREHLAMSLLEQMLLWCDAVNPNTTAQKLDARVRRAMAYICDHYRSPITLEDLALAAGVSASRLAHLFPQELGLTPMQYLEQHRIEIARQRLAATNDSISAIAERVGYGSASYFSKVFRRVEGCSPRESRQRAAAGALGEV